MSAMPFDKVLIHVLAGPRPAPPLAEQIFRPNGDGVTGM
jgi:hypothetical protein